MHVCTSLYSWKWQWIFCELIKGQVVSLSWRLSLSPGLKGSIPVFQQCVHFCSQPRLLMSTCDDAYINNFLFALAIVASQWYCKYELLQTEASLNMCQTMCSKHSFKYWKVSQVVTCFRTGLAHLSNVFYAGIRTTDLVPAAAVGVTCTQCVDAHMFTHILVGFLVDVLD